VKRAGGKGKRTTGGEQPLAREGGKFNIEVPFEDALRAALEVTPKKAEGPSRASTKRGKAPGNEPGKPRR
jgi:hypothetical protein